MKNNNQMVFTTSNKNKIKEIKRIFPEAKIIKGKDLPEVKGTSLEVAKYKSLMAGKNFVIEDTILEIDDKEIVDIKWLINDLKKYKGKKAKWIVTLGYNNGKEIKLYQGIIEGKIGNPYKNENNEIEGFGFDPYFYINFKNSLSKLEKEGLKDNYSARKIALENLKKENYILKENINNIPKWNGKWQNEEQLNL